MQVEEDQDVVIDESGTDDMEDFLGGADGQMNEEVEHLPSIEAVTQKPVVKILEVDNPEWVAYNSDLKILIRKFVDDHLGIPSITYETFHGFINHEVERIWHAQQAKVPDRLIHIRFLAGFVNDTLAGFLQCGMLPQRLPHISTLTINYIYSENVYLTSAFMKRIAQYKKLWRAKHIACIAVNERVHHALSRVLTGYRLCGYHVYGYNTKHRTISTVVDST